MQHYLHESEIVQELSLYSVTTFIFLMGVTESFWIKKHVDGKKTVMFVILNKMIPVLLEYIFASMVYMLVREGINLNYNDLIKEILSFSAIQAFYFFRYYFILTFISPCIFVLIRLIDSISYKILKIFFLIFFTIVVFIVSHILSPFLIVIGSSYLGMYVMGMIWGYYEAKIKKSVIIIILGSGMLLYGGFLTHVFYNNYLQGNYNPICINKIFPKWQMNPPNMGIMLYSLGVIICGSVVFLIIKEYKNLLIQSLCKLFTMLGKYSLDIYVWHILILNFLNDYTFLGNIWCKRMVYYILLFHLPMIGRQIYIKLKKIAYDTLSESSSLYIK